MTRTQVRNAVAGALGGLVLATLPVLAGCTDDGDDGDSWDESVAAYVGEVAITEAEVDELAGAVRTEITAEIEQELEQAAEDLSEEELAARREQRFGQLEEQMATTRTRVIEMRILSAAADQYIFAEGLDPPDVPQVAIEQQAHDLGLSEDNRYVHLVAEFLATLTVLQNEARSVPPSETDQREVYDNLVAAGLTSVPFEDAQQVLTQELMGEQVGMRNLLALVVDRAEIRVSPAYDLVYRVPVPMGGQAESWLGLPLGQPG